MKAVILSRDPGIRLVDISHEVPPQQVDTAGFILSSVWREFPPGTVHLVVVDPGVGSSRRAIVAQTGGQVLIGPDNGVLDWVLARDPQAQVREIQNESLARRPVSRTFHGRDLFAPAAAAAAAGYPFAEFGPRVTRWVRGPDLLPQRDDDGTIRSTILHVDRFGNGVTSLRPEDLPGGPGRYRYRVGSEAVTEVRDYYAAGAGDRPFAIWGSAGYLELSVAGGSAAERLGFRTGAGVVAEPI